VNLQEAEVGANELKRTMKEIIDSEFAVTQKLAYEKQARRDLDVTSLNLCLCKNLRFQKLAMNWFAHETIKDVFIFPFPKILELI
jgi:hypothetical protein